MKTTSTIFLLFMALSVKAQTTHNVEMQTTAFVPATLTITEGDEVVWENVSSVIHTSTSGAGCNADALWNSGNVLPGNTYARIFNVAGVYEYFCIYHCTEGMLGTITVQAITGNKTANNDISFSVFPNPAASEAVLTFSLQEASDINLEVYDAVGNRMPVSFENESFSSGENSVRLNISNLEEGAYFIKILLNEEKLYLKKFMKR